MKRIKINEFISIDTDEQSTTDRAIANNFIVTDIPTNARNYKLDNSDRPETIARLESQASQKIEQDKINETVNKPNLIESLKTLNNEKTATEIRAMSFEQLVEYHSNMVSKPQLIERLHEMKKDDPCNCKNLTFAEIQNKINEELKKVV